MMQKLKRTHEGNVDILERYQHILRDNGNGTLAFGIESADGSFSWVETSGSFPTGAVRVVIAFHNYTGTKNGDGPGFDDNASPSQGGFTWHWDNLAIKANKATPSEQYFNGHNAERIVTPTGCVSFSQGQRENPGNKDIEPRFHCIGDADIEF